MTHPIFTLIFYNNLIEVTALIQSDPGAVNIVDPEFYGRTPLHLACQEGNLSAVKVLLEHGGSVVAVDQHLKSPLHLAAGEGHRDILAWTLEHHGYHFDINMQDFQGWSILHTAALNGRSYCCSVILQFQPNIEMKDYKEGGTALDFACYSGDKETVKVLLDHGAQPSFDQSGDTALHIAAKEKHPEIVEMLVLGYKWDVNTVSTIFFHFVSTLKSVENQIHVQPYSPL